MDADGVNPEHSENDATGGSHNNIIPVSAPALKDYASMIGLGDNIEAIINAAAHLINHGAGHNSAEEHNGKKNHVLGIPTNSLIMMEGNMLKKFFSSSPYKTMFVNTIPSWNKDPKARPSNETFVNSVKRRFGNGAPKVNYKAAVKLSDYKK